ncbi:MAG: HAD-IIB family hydrolase [Planctomycetaceae bacterium]|nr:HAD-IIB family hydrolase [Planctomycetaceae bacterium]
MQRILATDLDGTLIPLDGHSQNRADLSKLSTLIESSGCTLVFVTGRHLASVEDVRVQEELPCPHWIICDVGTSIYHLNDSGVPELVSQYAEHLAALCSSMSREHLVDILAEVAGLRMQESEKQGPFKLSYYIEQSLLQNAEQHILSLLQRHEAPYSLICSVDPFNGDGLVDLLPQGVSKDFALAWWTEHVNANRESILFAGDSGNDFAPLTAGYRGILVANSPPDLADRILSVHQDRNWSGRLYRATQQATSGVLEGCRHFGLFEPH